MLLAAWHVMVRRARSRPKPRPFTGLPSEVRDRQSWVGLGAVESAVDAMARCRGRGSAVCWGCCQWRPQPCG
uniref:Uncharacterized protein n=1 Tax=Arundo donax TaxID=35708 RepID=A0A0A9FMJ6_ARUDO